MLAAMDPRGPAIAKKALNVVRPRFRLALRHGIHGLPHWSRVFWHGRALARELDVDPRLLATWDEKAHGWKVAAGDYEVQLGASSAAITARATAAVAAQTVPVGLRK
jgi:hypothetical protein